jgi:oxidase EvaA
MDNALYEKMKMETAALFAESWLETSKGVNALEDILRWVEKLNKTVLVEIHKTALENTNWFYDESEGRIVNQNRSFFQVAGFRQSDENGVLIEQPIIIQDEIGYLGFLCKEIGGVLHFLAQAKIEPGNVNKIQISPTIQATKSNFTQKHGGKKPAYLDYFLNSHKYTVIVDQIQSEQSSRFLKKRNRNIIVMIHKDEPIEELPSHKWLTLGQIKKLLKIENLVNMDTRTVLSCIPFYRYENALKNILSISRDTPLVNSIIDDSEYNLSEIYGYINNYKMFSGLKNEIIPLFSLKNWEMRNNEFVCKDGYAFKVIFRDISIEGREVKRWSQPLFEATGMAVFGLFTTVVGNVRKFLARAFPEAGCFDGIELGPTVQLEAGAENGANTITELFMKKYRNNEGVRYNVVLSEEGGRFYHEQNYNIIIEIDRNELDALPAGYFWATYRTLNQLTQINNCLNIQLRNLLSLLEI